MSRTQNTPRRLAGVLPLVLIACGSFNAVAGALPFNCASLEAVVAEAPTRFNTIKGVSVSQETAADLAMRLGVPLAKVDRDYVRRVYTADTPMPGAKHCEVVDLWHGDADARVSQSAHVCLYPDVSTLSAAFNTQLAQCLGRTPDPDADAYSVAIDIDTVVSGEGYAHTQVTANAQPLDGLQLSVVQTICENRREGGCDEDVNQASLATTRETNQIARTLHPYGGEHVTSRVKARSPIDSGEVPMPLPLL